MSCWMGVSLPLPQQPGPLWAHNCVLWGQPRVHADLLTVAYRGPLANKFRELAEQHEMSVASTAGG